MLTIDGVGEWTTTSISVGNMEELEIAREIRFPHSVGLLYSSFTAHLGFKVNSGEYKVMGLAPYGRPIFLDTIFESLVSLHEDGSFALNMEFFDFATGSKMTSEKFAGLFGVPARRPESTLDQCHMDLAASIQAALEEIVFNLAQATKELTGKANLCLAGGVALNCVSNGKLQRSGIFKSIWVQPAAGDAGGALGAALAAYYRHFKGAREVLASDSMQGALLGPYVRSAESSVVLRSLGAVFVEVGEPELSDRVAQDLAEGKVVGWVKGRTEFGPRALGNRSILADPSAPDMQRQLNLKVKFRESFRPFAPCVLAEYVSEWFEMEGTSPYMLFTAPIRGDKRIENPRHEVTTGINRLHEIRSRLSATTHVDFLLGFRRLMKNATPTYIVYSPPFIKSQVPSCFSQYLI